MARYRHFAASFALIVATCASTMEYGTSWQSLISGTSCPFMTPLTTKTGLPGGEITCSQAPDGSRFFRFPAGLFDIDQQVVVPAQTSIQGNSNPVDPADKAREPNPATQTYFIATTGVTDEDAPYCGTDQNMQQGDAQKLRIGFLLNSNTVVRHINYQGKDTTRPLDNGNLCGGGAFETPGCVSPGFGDGVGIQWKKKRVGCYDHTGKPNDLIIGSGKGVENVLIDSVRLNGVFLPTNTIEYTTAQGTQVAVWVAMTQDGSPTKNVTVRNLVSMLTRGDGINYHGNVQDSVVEDCHIENTGDDIYAFWGAYAENPTNNVFRNNVGKNPGVTRGFGYGVCVAVYGAKVLTIVGTKCYDIRSWNPSQVSKGNKACKNGPFCNSCFAFVHDDWFGAVYPRGNAISIYDNEYLYLDGSPILTDKYRPLLRVTKGYANVIKFPRHMDAVADTEYDTWWQSLISGTTCPPRMPLTTKNGRIGDDIKCWRASDGGRHFKFPAGSFDIDQQVVVPAQTSIEGHSNPVDPADKAREPNPATQTYFIAKTGVTDEYAAYCGTNKNMQQGDAQKLRIGFLLNSNTVVRHINFQGKDTTRPYDNGNLCGGGAFETPGCVSPGFGDGRGTAWQNKRVGCYDHTGEPNDLILGNGKGVENVLIDSVRLNGVFLPTNPNEYATAEGTQVAVWVAMTQDGSPTKNVTVRNLVSMLTRGDGINYHGNVQDSVVEDCHIENTGDDIYAFWGAYAENPTNNVFRNNVGKNPGVTRNYEYGVCVAVYGAKLLTITGTTCYDIRSWNPGQVPHGDRKCKNGAYCNSCLAYLHDGWFGAVYPPGNTISIYDNTYLYLDGTAIPAGGARTMIRIDEGSAHVARFPSKRTMNLAEPGVLYTDLLHILSVILCILLVVTIGGVAVSCYRSASEESLDSSSGDEPLVK